MSQFYILSLLLFLFGLSDEQCNENKIISKWQKSEECGSPSHTNQAIKINFNILLPLTDGEFFLNTKEIWAALNLLRLRFKQEGIDQFLEIPEDGKNIIDTQCSSKNSFYFLESIFKLNLDSQDPYYRYIPYVLGLACDNVCTILNILYEPTQIPIVSFGCSQEKFMYNKRFLTFGSSNNVSLKILYNFFSLYPSWEKICIIYTRYKHDIANTIKSDLEFQFKKSVEGTLLINDKCKIEHFSLNSTVYKEIVKILEQRRYSSNIYIILLNDCQTIYTMMAAYKRDMLSNLNIHYAFLTFNFANNLDYLFETLEDSLIRIMMKSLEGLITINQARPINTVWPHFVQDLLKIYNPLYPINSDISVYTAMFYDSIYLFGRAIQNVSLTYKSLSLQRNGIFQYIRNYSELMEREDMRRLNRSYILSLGKLKINENQIFTDYSVEMVQAGSLFPMYNAYYSDNYSSLILQKGIFYWPGNHITAPSGEPNCVNGWNNARCRNIFVVKTAAETVESIRYLFLLIFLFAILLAALIFLLVILKSRRISRNKTITPFIIKWRHIVLNTTNHPQRKTLESIIYQEMHKRSNEPNNLNINANNQNINSNNELLNEEMLGFFCGIGIYKGMVCCIDHIDLNVNKSDKWLYTEINQIKNLMHENLNQIIGVCLDKPHICIVSMYAKFGSLADILHDWPSKLSLEFKLSFITDIANGMEFLHKSDLKVHGHLSSQNCLIDNKWTCKVADFGLPTMQEWKEKNINNNDLLYVAPEILRKTSDFYSLKHGTQAGDVFAFGIILQEIITKKIPYYHERKILTIFEIVNKIMLMGQKIPFRPHIPDSLFDENLSPIMRSCLFEIDYMRPSFNDIVVMARKATKGRTIYMIDILLEKLEKHTLQLEALVNRRTKELISKKAEVERILFNILPESIARTLLSNHSVEPEYFENATIYFSDIVGFNYMCSLSTPIDVVTFLNSSFSIFDDITGKYKVYKCETVRDVYMVASGIPVRNDNGHAAEAASLALHLMSASTGIRASKLPNKIFQLRIGMNSGSVVAGVIGVKMPHYCLFGDTINTAARMQTGGYALRIHLSTSTAQLLKKDPNFILECRGEIPVKGKGTMVTYWLNGKKGFNLKMPNKALIASDQFHHFK